jgi:outer membrane receptor protein involved in Fe transport
VLCEMGVIINLNRIHFLETLFALICVVLLLAGYARPLAGQAFYGSLLGRVSDPHGDNVTGALVTLRSLATGEERKSTTDNDGNYHFVNLVPGPYRLEVGKDGFKQFIRESIDVPVDTSVPIDVTLTLGDLRETLEVKGQNPLLDSQGVSIGQVIEGRQVEDTPLNGRNVMNLLALVPGVIPQGGTQGSTAGNYTNNGNVTNVAGFGNYQIGGGLAGQAAFLFDGSSLNQVWQNNTVLVPTQDAVQEFRVVTSVPGAEFGGFSGGVVSFTTKSGANAFHGSAYEYLRNTVLDANNFFNNASGVSRSQLVQNQFGVDVAGPVVKNRTFVFFNYERFTRRNGIPFQGRTPTAAELNGDFRADPPIYDALTGQQFVCNGELNVICANRIDPTANVMANDLHYWPAPNANLDGGLVNYSANAAAGVDTNQYNARVDQIVSDKLDVFARYTYWQIDTHPTKYVFGTTGDGPTSTVRGLVQDNQAVIGAVYTFNPTTVVDLRLSYLGARTPLIPANNNVDMSQFGPFWANISSSLTHQQFPDPIILGTISYPYGGMDVTTFSAANNYAIAGSLTKISGRHTLKFGADLRRYDFRNFQTVAAAGLFVFAGIFTSGPLSPPGSGATPIADFVLGDITPIPGTSALFTAVSNHARQYYQGYYASDSFQISHKLTLIAGLRWDIPGSYAEAKDLNTTLLAQLQDPLVLVRSAQHPSRNDLEAHYRLFAPRVGVAYQLGPQTVIRAAYGINYLPQGVGFAGPWESPINSASTSVPFGGTLSNPLLGQPLLQPIGRNESEFNTFIGQSIQSRIPDQPFPYMQQWNLNVQQALGDGALVKIVYAGARGEHIPLGVPALTIGYVGANLNQLSPKYYSLGAALLQPTSSGQTLGQTLRPYPNYQNVGADSDFAGDTYYNSLQFTFEKRFSYGGTILADYTFSKLISNAENAAVYFELNSPGSGAIQDYTNLRAERSLALFDVPHRFVLSYILELPFGRGKRFLPDATGAANKLLAGWSVSGITTLASGFPLSIVSAAPNALSTYFGAGTIRPNVVPGCDKSAGGSISEHVTAGTSVINAACFVAPGAFSLGNESRVDPTLRAQGINNWDFSISKNTRLTEQVSLDFRAEFFNLFNRVQFGPPNTSFGGSTFGLITSQANNPRQIQFSLRASF